MAGMYIEGRKIQRFADVQRNYNYEIVFQNAASLVDGWEQDDVTLRARSFTIPTRGNEAIESNYGAMKQFFPGKPTFSNTMDITFEETESQGVARFLHAWQQKIFNVNDGHANYSRKRGNNGGNIASKSDGVCDVVEIRAYKQDGTLEDNKYFLQNAWLQNVAEVNLDFSQAGDAIKFVATIQYDFWSYGTEVPLFGATGGSPEVVGRNDSIKEN